MDVKCIKQHRGAGQVTIDANQEESTCISVAIIREMAAGSWTAESYHPRWKSCNCFL